MKSPIKSWSDAKFKGWIISLLRRGTMRWPPRNEALAKAKTEKKINTATGRMAQHYECAMCKGQFSAKNVVVDHINPVVLPGIGFIDWNTYIERMFCSVENLQVLDKNCHDIKSATEKGQRKTNSQTGN
jgi:5-methylcytosine-specific restriction endonuclease McrA